MEGFSVIQDLNFENQIKESTFLVTGGAGFIGSNLVRALLIGNAKNVRVIDNLSTGNIENLEEFFGYSNFEFIEGDIDDISLCHAVVKGTDFVSHQAALGSVPRSIQDPIRTNNSNITGFLNVLQACKESKQTKKLVYAASSSTYGDSQRLPKKEGYEGEPLSPYAVTKLVNELYAEVFSKVYNFHSIGLRYFNVFGPKQGWDNPYAAVIPRFCKAFIENESPVIYGDGSNSRDFTYIENVIYANFLSFFNSNGLIKHQVYNVGCGERISLISLFNQLKEISGKSKLKPIFEKPRKGDVKHSQADLSKIKRDLNYQPVINFSEGLSKTYNWNLNE